MQIIVTVARRLVVFVLKPLNLSDFNEQKYTDEEKNLLQFLKEI